MTMILLRCGGKRKTSRLNKERRERRVTIREVTMSKTVEEDMKMAAAHS